MNIYGKLAKARAEFHALNLKKTGHNSFAGYKYFELADFLIPGMAVMADNGLVPVISFDDTHATMTIHETDGDGSIVITSPMRDANLKGCHPIQNLGACETYQRRYCWMAALEIVEHDAVDAGPAVDVDNTPITETQAMALRDYIKSTDSDETAFCKHLKIRRLEDLPARAYDTAMSLLHAKERANKKKVAA